MAAVASAVSGGMPAAVIADASVLASHALGAAAFASRLSQGLPHVRAFVRLTSRTGIARSERAWASRVGIASLLPGSTTTAWKKSLAPVIERVVTALGSESFDADAIGMAVNGLMKSGAEPRPGPVREIYDLANRLERDGVDGAEVFEALRSERGLVADRRYRGKIYPECFVASEAIDFMASRFSMKRETALATGMFLWGTGRIHHVLRDASFGDGYFFFRIGGTPHAAGIDLGEVQSAMRARDGVQVADRVYMGKTYGRCFVGSEAVDWLRHRYRLTQGEAESTGQSLLELGELHHVLDEHGFVSEGYYYRFRADEGDL